MTQLTKHFTLAELTASQIASRLGINNAPNPTQVDNLREVCNAILEKCRVRYGRAITPSSGFRCRDLEISLCERAIKSYLNRNPGGTVDDYLKPKQHPKGEAVDFKVSGVPNMLLAEWIRDNCEYDQLILEYPRKDDPFAGWVHVSFSRQGTNRREVLTALSWGYVKGLAV